jgi:Peptidase_C39 like family
MPSAASIAAPLTGGHAPVTWLSQYDGLANAASNCGPTTMAMAVRAYGAYPEDTGKQVIAKMAAARGKSVYSDGGTPALGMENMAKSAGLRCTLNPDSSFARITGQLAAEELVAIAGDTFSLPYNYYPNRSEGHWILCTAYDPSTKLFEIMDPADSRPGPRYLTNAELGAFLAGNDGKYTYGGSMPIGF